MSKTSDCKKNFHNSQKNNTKKKTLSHVIFYDTIFTLAVDLHILAKWFASEALAHKTW